MKFSKRQLHVISVLAETILNYRLEPNEVVAEYLNGIRKRIRGMVSNNCYEEGILQMLTSKESYQIEKKVRKFMEQTNYTSNQICVQLQISVIQKINCQIYNSETWQFMMSLQEQSNNKITESSEAIVRIIQSVATNLLCFHLLPVNKNNKNKYMLDYKVTILSQQSITGILNYSNISLQRICAAKIGNSKTKNIELKFYYNDNKTQQGIKEIIKQKNNQSMMSGIKKYSTETACTSCNTNRVSIYEFYDSELDITVLSNEDPCEDAAEHLQIELQQSQEQFQLLVQQNLIPNEDQQFLKKNFNLFKQICSQSYDYL